MLTEAYSPAAIEKAQANRSERPAIKIVNWLVVATATLNKTPTTVKIPSFEPKTPARKVFSRSLIEVVFFIWCYPPMIRPMMYVTVIVNMPDKILRKIPCFLLALLKIAAPQPVKAKAIKTAIKVAMILIFSGKIVIASIGNKEPVGNESIEASAAA